MATGCLKGTSMTDSFGYLSGMRSDGYAAGVMANLEPDTDVFEEGKLYAMHLRGGANTAKGKGTGLSKQAQLDAVPLPLKAEPTKFCIALVMRKLISFMPYAAERFPRGNLSGYKDMQMIDGWEFPVWYLAYLMLKFIKGVRGTKSNNHFKAAALPSRTPAYLQVGYGLSGHVKRNVEGYKEQDDTDLVPVDNRGLPIEGGQDDTNDVQMETEARRAFEGQQPPPLDDDLDVEDVVGMGLDEGPEVSPEVVADDEDGALRIEASLYVAAQHRTHDILTEEMRRRRNAEFANYPIRQLVRMHEKRFVDHHTHSGQQTLFKMAVDATSKPEDVKAFLDAAFNASVLADVLENAGLNTVAPSASDAAAAGEVGAVSTEKAEAMRAEAITMFNLRTVIETTKRKMPVLPVALAAINMSMSDGVVKTTKIGGVDKPELVFPVHLRGYGESAFTAKPAQLVDAYEMARRGLETVERGAALTNAVGTGKTNTFLLSVVFRQQMMVKKAIPGDQTEYWPTIIFSPPSLMQQTTKLGNRDTGHILSWGYFHGDRASAPEGISHLFLENDLRTSNNTEAGIRQWFSDRYEDRFNPRVRYVRKGLLLGNVSHSGGAGSPF